MFYHFLLEGENIDGDLITEFVEFENFENEANALRTAEKEAESILKHEGGGHIDIFNESGEFVIDVEV